MTYKGHRNAGQFLELIHQTPMTRINIAVDYLWPNCTIQVDDHRYSDAIIRCIVIHHIHEQVVMLDAGPYHKRIA